MIYVASCRSYGYADTSVSRVVSYDALYVSYRSAKTVDGASAAELTQVVTTELAVQ